MGRCKVLLHVETVECAGGAIAAMSLTRAQISSGSDGSSSYTGEDIHHMEATCTPKHDNNASTVQMHAHSLYKSSQKNPHQS